MSTAHNVLGKPLEECCRKPLTGFYRNGRCDTGPGDEGLHILCARMTDEFLEYSQEQGNDLSTPAPEFGFPGLKEGDCWCICVDRWKEALEAGVAPPVNLASTHISALEFVDLADLQSHAIEPSHE